MSTLNSRDMSFSSMKPARSGFSSLWSVSYLLGMSSREKRGDSLTDGDVEFGSSRMGMGSSEDKRDGPRAKGNDLRVHPARIHESY